MSRVIIRTLGLAALLALVATSAFAGSDERKGTSGAPELLIPVGARGSALGSAAVSDIVGAEALFWNPAGLAGQEGAEVIFTNTQYFADMKLNFFGVTGQAGSLGQFGVNVKALSVGDIFVTTEQSPDGTGEIVSPTFSVLGASWAKAFTDRVRFGATVNFVSEKILSMSATGLAADFGVQYDTGWKGLKFGMVMKNFGTSMHYDGDNLDVNVQSPGQEPSASNRTLRFSSSNFEMPSYFTLAATYNAWQRGPSRVQVLGSFQNNNFGGDSFTGGAEWTYRDMFALRGSWFGTVNTSTDLLGDTSTSFDGGDDLYSGFAFGAGGKINAGGTKIGVDVTVRPIRNYFDDTVEMGLRLKF